MVREPINLNDEPTGKTDEIHNVGRQGILSPNRPLRRPATTPRCSQEGVRRHSLRIRRFTALFLSIAREIVRHVRSRTLKDRQRGPSVFLGWPSRPQRVLLNELTRFHARSLRFLSQYGLLHFGQYLGLPGILGTHLWVQRRQRCCGNVIMLLYYDDHTLMSTRHFRPTVTLSTTIPPHFCLCITSHHQ